MSMLKLQGALHSRTIKWLGLPLAVCSAVHLAMPAVQAFIPAKAYGWAGLLLSALIAGFRWITTTPLDELEAHVNGARDHDGIE